MVAPAPVCSGLLSPFPGSASSVPAAPAPGPSRLLPPKPASVCVGDGGGAGVGASGGAEPGGGGGDHAGRRRERGGENSENRARRGDEIPFFLSIGLSSTLSGRFGRMGAFCICIEYFFSGNEAIPSYPVTERENASQEWNRLIRLQCIHNF
jgi:hypothetical protein